MSAFTPLLPQFPGLDGGTQGHWGNQSEPDWVDGRWNDTRLGSVQTGIFRLGQETVRRAVCVRLGDNGELACCFDPDTLGYAAVWKPAGDRYLNFSDVRHGFMHGVTPHGIPLEARSTAPLAANSGKPAAASTYRGFYRHGHRVLFSYLVGTTEYLDAPWVTAGGEFERIVLPRDEHPLKHLTAGGPPESDWSLVVAGQLGTQSPFAVDTIPLPFENPWRALLFPGGHAFLPDGSALIGTMQGDVWHASGLDERLEHVRWRRFASGLHHIQGMWIDGDGIFALGRDQLTRLHDLNDDGAADFYESFSRAYETSAAGHDFICGLERDSHGRFYTVSGNQGLVRIAADGRTAEVLATGFRNPDGLGLMPDGTITIPCSEGEWTPASMICAIPAAAGGERPRGLSTAAKGGIPYFGYGGPKNGEPPALPLVYLPRGIDNSSGGQVAITSHAWKPVQGHAVHLSFGAGTALLLLQDEVRGQRQGALMPLQTEFLSGAHRGRFHPRDGQLYVSGMAGWGCYTPQDGCFQRVRLTDLSASLPTGFRVHENGVLLHFSQPLDKPTAEQPRQHFAQCWNYRYSAAYGSPEMSPSHPGTPGHDPLVIAAAHVVGDGRSLFLELPDLQPVNQLHLVVGLSPQRRSELFLTVHALAEPFTEFSGYRSRPKTIAAHPILGDLALALRSVPNRWTRRNAKARPVTLDTAGNLSFATRSIEARPGEALALTLRNPDVVPHNWALVKPGALQTVGEAANRLIADPEAVLKQYVPELPEVLYYTDIVPPGGEFTIWITAPREPGRYPYLCTFPGHWMVMNGEMVVRE
jgi:azurin